MEILPKISIVTVNFNQGEYLEQTILSVLNQNYSNLEYIIIDGGSTDNSVEIIKKYQSHLTYWISEKDEGMYHAVEKGFSKCTGEIMAWINSDDFYMPHTFVKVAEIFKNNQAVNWIRSLPLECTQDGEIYNRIAEPWARWSKYRYLTMDFQFIQQESCFWRRSVWLAAGAHMDHSIKYAGDMELWARFFRKEKLYTVRDHFAVFRHRPGHQISKIFLKEYLNEGIRIIQREKKRLSWMANLKLLGLYWIRIFYGPFFFYNVPLLKYIYPTFLDISPVLKRDVVLMPNKRQIKLPPVIVGKYVVQRRIVKL